MPLYDYQCKKCGKTFEELRHIDERLSVKCICGGEVSILVTNNKTDWFRPHWNENFDLKPIYVESKQHYRKLCKQYGLTARALM